MNSLSNRGNRIEAVERLQKNGVEVIGEVYVSEDSTVGRGTVIFPGTIIRGCVIGENCEIGPNSNLINCQIGDGSTLDNVRAENSEIGGKVRLGPFVNIRPGTVVHDGAKIGNFVELKNSEIGEKTSVAHLTYIGDSDVGHDCNFGCGCVTANYDGVNKHRTEIGDGAFIGCNTNLIAPVKIGEGASTGAGSTITKDVPPWTLAVERGDTRHSTKWENNRIRLKKARS